MSGLALAKLNFGDEPDETAPLLPPPHPDIVLRETQADDDTDIVEREPDIALIVEVARSLKNYPIEHAVSIVETRDPETDTLSYRIVSGDPNKRRQDSAELARLELMSNERLVADVHNHPAIKCYGQGARASLIASRATSANYYPGAEDYKAVLKRGVVSAILDPSGGVMLLRRVAGAPSIRKVYGETLPPLDEASAARLHLAYLFKQGYLTEAGWTRPDLPATLHAGP